MTRRNEGGATTAPRRLRWTLLLVAALWPPDGARAGVEPVAPAEPARLLTIDARLGAGGDTNVTRDPEASTRGAVARVELHGALATRHLQLEVGSWFHQYLPRYQLNEADLRLLALYRRSLALSRRSLWRRVGVHLGAFGEYQRQLATEREGRLLTDGAVLVDQLDAHVAAGLGVGFGPCDLELGGQGDARRVAGARADDDGAAGSSSYQVLGAAARVALRWVPSRLFSLRAGYGFLFRHLAGLEAVDLSGEALSWRRDLNQQAHQLDLAAHLQPLAALRLVTRYQLAQLRDDFVGFYSGWEHRLWASAALRARQRLVVEASVLFAERQHPLRLASATNQTEDRAVSAVADAELRLSRHWGLFARYQLDAAWAQPYGVVFVRHVALGGLAARTEVKW